MCVPFYPCSYVCESLKIPENLNLTNIVLSMKHNFYTRMDGIEASVKTIMTALNIPVLEDRNTCNVQRPSSFEQQQSTPNTDSMAPDQSTRENMITSQILGGLHQSTSECLLNSIAFLSRV